MYVIEPDAPPGTPETGINLHEYAVGKYGDTFNENTGRLLKKGSRLRFDMHYFANGEESTDRTEMAFIFYPKGFVPKHRTVLTMYNEADPARGLTYYEQCAAAMQPRAHGTDSSPADS